MLRAALALTGAAALLLGCASPGAPHRPVALVAPAALGLANSASTLVTPRWWATLGDATLNRLVEQALQTSPSMAMAQARIARAQSLTELSRSAAGAQARLDADANAQRYSANSLLPPPIAGSVRSSATLQAGLNWSADLYGAKAADLASALGQTRAAQTDAAAAATVLAAQISQAYVGLARLLAQRDLLQRTLAQHQAILALTRERMAAGLDSRVQLTQAEGALPDTRAQLEAIAEQLMRVRRQIALLSGQTPSALDELSPRLDALTLDATPATLGADLLARRPDLVAARWRVESALHDIAVSQTRFYPNINLGAFVGLSALGLDKLLQAGSLQAGLSPALHLPLFDAGRLRAQLGARQAELDLALAQYNAAVVEAVKQAGDAIGSEQSLQRQQREQSDALASAQAAHAVAQQRFGAGLSGYLVVLHSESQLLAQQRQAAELRSGLLGARLTLLQALGGGWNDDTDASVATLHTGAPPQP